MAEVLFSNHENILREKNLENLIFLYGDPYLTDIVKNKLIDKLLPDENREFSVEKYDGSIKNPSEIIDIVYTFSFFSDKKVVVYNNPPFFESGVNYEKLAQRAKNEYLENKIGLSASIFLKLGNSLDSSFEVFSDEWKEKIVSKFYSGETDLKWVDLIIDHAVEKKLKPGDSNEENEFFIKAIDKELPESHFLIITAPKTDKKRKIHKKLKEKALLVDCSLPSGARKKDKDEREKIARELVLNEIAKTGKNITINSDALFLLLDYSGDDLRTVSKNLNQVITYSSNKRVISGEDIKRILERTREDPVFSFTGAVAEKNLQKSLFYMNSLISSGYHPLQIFASLTGQVNKLFLARDFLSSRFSSSFSSGMNYNLFTSMVVPEINAYDDSILAALEPLKFKPKKSRNDHVILGKGKNYYPVFLLLKNASLFSKERLEKAVTDLSNGDFNIKTGADPVKVLENFIFQFLT